MEGLEPGVHQFFPITPEWKDGTPAGERHWFNPCHRIDSIDRKKSTKPSKNKVWAMYKPGEVVFSRTQIGDRHVWIDKFIVGNRPFISDRLKDALEAANVSGLRLKAYAETN